MGKKHFRAVTDTVATGSDTADCGASGQAGSDRVYAAATPPAVVSESLAAALAKLDAEEIQYFILNVIQGKPRGKCREILGWSETKTHRVRMRLNLHLRRLRADPLPVLPPVSVPDLDDNVPILKDKPGGGYRSTTPARIYSFARGSSLNPFFKERLPSGLTTWTLSPAIERKFVTPRIIEGPITKEIKPMDLPSALSKTDPPILSKSDPGILN